MTYAVISDGWAVEHHFATGVSYATRLLPDGRFDTSVPEIVAEGYGHDHAIFDLIAEQIIADEDREAMPARDESWVLVPCPVCDGAGEWDEGPLPAYSGATEPDYRQVICPECEGTGRVFVSAEPVTIEDLEIADEDREPVEMRKAG